jgi:hypothetical protein
MEKEEEMDSDRSMLHARLLGHPGMETGAESQGVKGCLISDYSHPEARVSLPALLPIRVLKLS